MLPACRLLSTTFLSERYLPNNKLKDVQLMSDVGRFGFKIGVATQWGLFTLMDKEYDTACTRANTE
jgi:hypothetical protein